MEFADVADRFIFQRGKIYIYSDFINIYLKGGHYYGNYQKCFVLRLHSSTPVDILFTDSTVIARIKEIISTPVDILLTTSNLPQ